MRDLHSNITLVTLIGAAVLAADANSGWIDLQGYNSAEIALAVGIGGITFSSTNKIEFLLEHSDDGGTTSAPVTLNDVLGATSVTSGIIKSLVAAHAAADSTRFGYKGGKRYIRLTADFSGTHGTGTPIAALLIKAAGFNRPEANQA